MQTSVKQRRERFKAPDPKRSRRFQSVEEYLSYIEKKEPHYFLDKDKLPIEFDKKDWKDQILDDKITEEVFMDFLKCFDHMSKFLKKPVHTDHIKNLSDFYHKLDYEVNSIGTYSFTYFPDKKKMCFSDKNMSKVSKSIMSINMYLVEKIKPYISLQVWSYLNHTAHEVYIRALGSIGYDCFVDMTYDYIWEMSSCEDEDQEHFQALLTDIEAFDNIRNSLHEYASAKLDRRCKFTDVEKEIIKICDVILTYDQTMYYPFIDVELYRNMFESTEYIDPEIHNLYLDDHGEAHIVDSFVNGLYVLSYNSNFMEDDHYLSYYVDHINSLENEGDWGVDFSSRIEIDTEGNTQQELPNREPVIAYHDAFHNLETLLCQLLAPDAQSAS